MENLLTLANNFRKKFYKKLGSNSRRMSFKPRGYDERERYTLRQNDQYRPSRYERDDQQYEDRNERDRYARSSDRKERSEKRFETKDSEEKKVIERKPDGPSTCFKYGKEGHFARECTTKMSKAEILKRKLVLVEKEAAGQVLIAYEEVWVDYFDDETEEKCLTYFMGYQSKSTEDEDGAKAKVCCIKLESKKMKIMDGLHNQIT